MLIVANIDESDIGKEKDRAVRKTAPICRVKGIPVLAFCAKTEMEIAQLDEADRGEFHERSGY